MVAALPPRLCVPARLLARWRACAQFCCRARWLPYSLVGARLLFALGSGRARLLASPFAGAPACLRAGLLGRLPVDAGLLARKLDAARLVSRWPGGPNLLAEWRALACLRAHLLALSQACVLASWLVSRAGLLPRPVLPRTLAFALARWR